MRQSLHRRAYHRKATSSILMAHITNFFCAKKTISTTIAWPTPSYLREMRALFAGGDASIAMAQKALAFAQQRRSSGSLFDGQVVFYKPEEITLKAPIIPKKFFHTAGKFS